MSNDLQKQLEELNAVELQDKDLEQVSGGSPDMDMESGCENGFDCSGGFSCGTF